MLQNTLFRRFDKGYILDITVNEQFNGVLIKNIVMYVCDTCDDDGYFNDSDLAVNWSIEGLSNNADADTMGSLLLRNVHSDDEVTKAMSMFYWDRAFTTQLREILIEQGFNTKSAEEVSGSEWGMQEEGRASYDAYSIADDVRRHFNIAVTA